MNILYFNITKFHIIISVGILCLLASVVLALSLGMTVIQDYDAESVFKKTNCTVRATEFNGENPKNEWSRCPWRCTIQHTPDGLKTYCEVSEFPCLKIVVDVGTKYGLKSAILHENPDKMMKYPDCSTYYCNQDSVVNDKQVKKFKRDWGNVGKSYTCYYNMKSLETEDEDDAQEHALLKLTYNKASYINSIFWPCFVAFAGIALILYAFITRSIKKKEKQQQPRDHIKFSGLVTNT